jgi:hypothetical protein
MELQKLIDGLKAHKNGAASYESVDEAIRAFEAMRDVDGEKVLFGMECLEDGKTDEECKRCPYQPYRFGHCKYDVMRDALAVIRQQQERIKELEAGQTARVMTLEEVENALDTVVWLEEPEFENFADHYALIMAYSHKVGFVLVSFGFADMPVDCKYKYEDYGKKWRCWTQRPTDEQRKVVKWE